MKTILAFHGNPGSPADWNILSTMLDLQKFKLKAVDSYKDDWLHDVQDGPDKKILLAHSWGGYRILKNLIRAQSHVEKVILVCPFIQPETRLSSLSIQLLKLPVLGDALIKASHKKASATFVPHMIHPHGISDLPYYQELQNRFADWNHWKKAAFAKIQMQASPWDKKDVSSVPVFALYGAEDKSSAFETQNALLMHYPHLQNKVIQRAGHGLHWSHPEEIISILEGDLSNAIR